MALVQIANRWTSYFVSGTESPSSPDYRTHYYIYYDDNQDVANNRTRIQIDYYLKMVGTRKPTDMSSGVYINGSSTNNYISIPQKSYSTGTYYLGRKEWYIYHDSSGNGSFTFRGILYGGGKWTNRYTTGTTTYTLPTIPRYTSITNFYAHSVSLNSFAFTVTASDAIDWVQHSLNGGAWTDSGNQVISGLQPGTQYSLRTRVRRTSSGLWTESGTIYATTTQVAQITPSNVNFNIDDGITFAFTNPSGSTVDLYLESPNGTNRVTRTGISSPYTLTLNTSEKNTLFGLAPTSNTLSFRFRLRTAGNNNYNHYRTGTASITNANPTFNNFTYADTNSATTTLTGNSQRIIKGYSNLRARITSANKMVAVKGATPKEYQLVVGSKQIKKDYHESNNVDLTLNAIDNNVFIVYAIDSRGNSTQKQISPATYIDYFKPTISDVKVSRQNNISTLTNLSFSGTFFNAGFGVVNNTLTATYRYKKTTASTWTNGGSIPLTISGNNFSCNRLIKGDKGASGFTITESFDIEITIKDLLSQDMKTEILVDAKPNLSMHRDGVALNGQYDENLESGVQLNGDGVYYNGLLLFGWSEE